MMKRFWMTFAATALVCAFAAPIVKGGVGLETIASVLPRFMALVLPLCAFPAGASAARHLVLGIRPSRRAIAGVVGGGVVIAALTLTMSSIFAPAGARFEHARQHPASTASDGTPPAPSPLLPAEMTLAELKTASESAAVARPDTEGAARLRRTNHLRWEYQQRLAHALLAVILACLGLCVAVWVRAWTSRSELQTLLLWTAGAMTVPVVYGSIESSFDAATGALAPIGFASTWHEVLGVPLTALVALGWTAWVAAARSREGGR